MVGKRLQKKCKNKGASCYQKEIAKEKNYIFKTDKGLKKELREDFPACFPTKEGSLREGRFADCKTKKKSFTKLRQAVLLNPGEKELWEILSCIYGEAGYSVNSEGLSHIAMAAAGKDETLKGLKALFEKWRNHKIVIDASQSSKEQDLSMKRGMRIYNKQRSLFRALGEMGPEEEEALAEGLDQDHYYAENAKIHLAYAAGGFRQTVKIKIWTKLMDSVPFSVSKSLKIAGAGVQEVEILNKLIEAADNSSNHRDRDDIRQNIAEIAGKMTEAWHGGAEVLKLLFESGATDTDEVKETIIDSASGIAYLSEEKETLEIAVSILQNLTKDKSPYVRYKTIRYSAYWLEEENRTPFLSEMTRDPVQRVRLEAMNELASYQEGREVLKALAESGEEQLRKEAQFVLDSENSNYIFYSTPLKPNSN